MGSNPPWSHQNYDQPKLAKFRMIVVNKKLKISRISYSIFTKFMPWVQTKLKFHVEKSKEWFIHSRGCLSDSQSLKSRHTAFFSGHVTLIFP